MITTTATRTRTRQPKGPAKCGRPGLNFASRRVSCWKSKKQEPWGGVFWGGAGTRAENGFAAGTETCSSRMRPVMRHRPPHRERFRPVVVAQTAPGLGFEYGSSAARALPVPFGGSVLHSHGRDLQQGIWRGAQLWRN